MNSSSQLEDNNPCHTETRIVRSKDNMRVEVVIIINNDDVAPQSVIEDSDNVTWCQELARS